MLAQTATGVDDALEKLGGTAIFEAKLDGARVQIHRTGDTVSIYTRSLDDITRPTARGRRGHPARCRRPTLIADGEAIALRPDGRPHRFQVTASRFGRSVDVDAARTAQPLSVFFFDLLHLDGVDLLDRPATDRLAALDSIVPAGQRVDRLVTSDAADAPTFLDVDPGRGPRGRDGEVAHRAVRGGPPGRRVAQDQAGAHPRPRRARHRMGIGPAHREAVQHPSRRPRPGNRRLRHAGQDVQGHDRRDARLADRAIHRTRGRRHRRATSCEVRPEQVVEIAFDGVQGSTRYPGGMALRFASVLRYRDDKSPAEADTIDTVRTLYERD